MLQVHLVCNIFPTRDLIVLVHSHNTERGHEALPFDVLADFFPHHFVRPGVSPHDSTAVGDWLIGKEELCEESPYSVNVALFGDDKLKILLPHPVFCHCAVKKEV